MTRTIHTLNERMQKKDSVQKVMSEQGTGRSFVGGIVRIQS